MEQKLQLRMPCHVCKKIRTLQLNYEYDEEENYVYSPSCEDDTGHNPNCEFSTWANENGEILVEEESPYVCSECNTNRFVWEYHDGHLTVPLRFLGSEDRSVCHIGFQTEFEPIFAIQTGEYDIETQSLGKGILDALESNGNKNCFYCEQDRDFMKIVSLPGTVKWHKNNEEIYDLAFHRARMMERDGNSFSKGLHTTIDVGFFSNPDEGIANVIDIVEKFWRPMCVFSRATKDRVVTWATKWNRKGKDVVADTRFERYHDVSLQHAKKPNGFLEIKTFSATLEPDVLIAAIKLTERIAIMAETKTEQEIQNLSWRDLLGEDKELWAYWEKVRDAEEWGSYNKKELEEALAEEERREEN